MQMDFFPPILAGYVVPIKLNNEAHEAFLLFQQDGVPLAIICDNAKEVVLVSSIRNSMRHHFKSSKQDHSLHGTILLKEK